MAEVHVDSEGFAIEQAGEVSRRDGRSKNTATSTSSVELITITREDLVDAVSKRNARDDSFFTLPFTVFQLFLFIVLIIQHLQIFERQELESALQEWVQRTADTLIGPYPEQDISSIDDLWEWIEMSGVPAIYGGEVHSGGGPEVELASASLLVGDVQLWQRRRDGSEQSVWLLHAYAAAQNLTAGPFGNFTAAGLAVAKQLKESDWINGDTQEFQVRYCSFNERAGMFGLTEVIIDFGQYGVMRPRVISTAAQLEPYPNWFVLVLDGLYVLLILYKFQTEGWEILQALQVGFAAFVDYWGIWNVVDWTDVVLGVVGAGFWIRCSVAMNADALHSLVGQGSPKPLAPGAVNLDLGRTESLFLAIMDLRQIYVELHLIFAANMVAIMAKFLKAFEANPRLKVVSATLTQSFKDIIHFLLVFLTVFLSFAVIAHVLFGGDLVEFYTTSSAMNTGFYVLMGEFTWYVDMQHYYSDILPSGMPFVLLNLWFFSYMFFVLLVLLNMLLAIILSHYTNVTQANYGSQTLWEQSKDYVKWKKNTFGFYRLSKIQLQLESDNAHPEERVEVETLMSAFPRMKENQAEFIVDWLREEKFQAQQVSHPHSNALISLNNETLVQEIQGHIRSLVHRQSKMSARLDRMENAGGLGGSEGSPITI